MKRTEENKEMEFIKVDGYEVKNVREVKGGKKTTVFFTLVLNGITIYNCKVIEGKNGDFISYPQTKDKDGKWWNVCFARLSDEDQKKIIADVEKAL